MLYFRKKAKFKISESYTMSNNYSKLRENGLKCLNFSALLISISSFLVFYNTFPDSIAIFNPFRVEIGLRGVNYKDTFFIFVISYSIIWTLIKNSLWFTGPWSRSYKSIVEFSKVKFTKFILLF